MAYLQEELAASRQELAAAVHGRIGVIAEGQRALALEREAARVEREQHASERAAERERERERERHASERHASERESAHSSARSLSTAWPGSFSSWSLKLGWPNASCWARFHSCGDCESCGIPVPA